MTEAGSNWFLQRKKLDGWMDFSPNLQKLRHSRAADILRRATYKLLVGDGWPPVFTAPDRANTVHAPSRNVYVHLPFCETICPHCPYNKIRFQSDLATQYQTALLREVSDYLARPDAMPVDTLYFGGGTPTLTPNTVAAVVRAFAPLLKEDAEVAVEAYPSDATVEGLRDLRETGINRISLGIESFDAALLRKLGRRYSPGQAAQAIRNAKGAGFEMVDVNLIFGIPGQQKDTFFDTVQKCLDEDVDQISAYPLFTFDHTPAGQARHEDTYARAPERQRLAMQRGVSEMCQAAGLERTSVWSFTRRGLTPYTTVTRPDYVGFGAGAGSKSQTRVSFNTFSVPAYIAASPRAVALQYDLSPREQRADWLYWQIYNSRIDAGEYEARFGNPITRDYGFALWLLHRIGFLKYDPNGFRLTERGAIWGHRIQSVFSLNGIDAVWTNCKREAWPSSVALA